MRAKWIWIKKEGRSLYNQTIVAKRKFEATKTEKAVLSITADSYYRLIVNDQWINDGPARAWPEHYKFDKIDVTPWLIEGENEIKIIATYFGCGTFHQIPQMPGLAAQLDMFLSNGKIESLYTDNIWQVAYAHCWISQTPKISPQMRPAEYYDARMDHECDYAQPEVLCRWDQGPWKDLQERDVALLTKTPVYFESFVGARAVQPNSLNFCVPVARLAFPGLIEANRNCIPAIGCATILNIFKQTELKLFPRGSDQGGFSFAVDGLQKADDLYCLNPGKHLLLCFYDGTLTLRKDLTIALANNENVKIQNPIEPEFKNPWCLIKLPEYCIARDDLLWHNYIQEDPDFYRSLTEYKRKTNEWLTGIRNAKQLCEKLSNKIHLLAYDEMFVEDIYWDVNHKDIIDKKPTVENVQSLIHDDPAVTTVEPCNCDVELIYDLGKQVCGYYDINLNASAGVIIDIYSAEYVNDNGVVQIPVNNRNGIRYIASDGWQKFTSLVRRSGRYIIVTIRNSKLPVHIRNIRVIESLYPAHSNSSFQCSDGTLNNIWNISKRTLKLCMEDTFTDCPLYEQTLWVGDARNESLFAYNVYEAEDLSKRCIKLAAESLERYPIVGCHVPSSWACLLPAWSFLWGISVWEYFWYSGDKLFLEQLWPAVLKNLKGAEAFINDSGLFTAPAWNFFDWAEIDQNHKTVLHNTFLLIGALKAAINCAQVLADSESRKTLEYFCSTLRKAVNTFWDDSKKAYPDSIHENGSISNSISQHTSFLSILYEVIEDKNIVAARDNLIVPPSGMVCVGSPFAAFYMYEAMEKLGLDAMIIKSIYDAYLPMLREGATTVWESFASGTLGASDFPTRSHCHAWSASPLYFLPRIILGIKQTRPGGKAFEISPQIHDLKWAKGTIMTKMGKLSVEWQINKDILYIKINYPVGTEITFTPNETHKGYEVKILYNNSL